MNPLKKPRTILRILPQKESKASYGAQRGKPWSDLYSSRWLGSTSQIGRTGLGQSGFALPIAILIVVVLIVAGGAGYYFYKTSQELEEIEIYPGAVEVEVPPNLAKEIRGDLSPDVEIKAYVSGDSAEKIQNWYKSYLPDKGWEKIWDRIREKGEFGFMLWKKDKIGFGVGLNLGPDVAGMTSILLVKDKFEAWGEILKILEKQESGMPPKPIGEKSEVEEPSEEEKKEEAKKLINEALLKIEEIKLEKAKPEADTHKLQTLIGEAIESGKEATELDPKNPEILFQMGNIYFEIQEIIPGADVWAEYYYKKALELDPDNSLYQEKLRKIQSQK